MFSQYSLFAFLLFHGSCQSAGSSVFTEQLSIEWEIFIHLFIKNPRDFSSALSLILLGSLFFILDVLSICFTLRVILSSFSFSLYFDYITFGSSSTTSLLFVINIMCPFCLVVFIWVTNIYRSFRISL